MKHSVIASTRLLQDKQTYPVVKTSQGLSTAWSRGSLRRCA